jgi:hypothetical protein
MGVNLIYLRAMEGEISPIISLTKRLNVGIVFLVIDIIKPRPPQKQEITYLLLK